jgi:hypothetical protein
LGIGKQPEKISVWWEISLSGRKNVFPCMDHLVLRHPSYGLGFTYPFCISEDRSMYGNILRMTAVQVLAMAGMFLTEATAISSTSINVGLLVAFGEPEAGGVVAKTKCHLPSYVVHLNIYIYIDAMSSFFFLYRN